MTIVELLLIAVGLSMDAFAVAVSKGLSVKRVEPKQALITGLWFGGFQALMPLVGYLLGVSFADIVQNIDHWIAFLLLGAIGVSMIRESLKGECERATNDFGVKTMLPLAVATSIDAMAVGVSFAFLGNDISLSVVIIGITTLLLSILGLYIGRHFGCRYKSKAELLGGVILVLMGVKILVEHTLIC